MKGEVSADSNNSEAGKKSDGRFVIKLSDGSMYDEVISGLQKMVRRGREEDALLFAISLYDSGYGMGLARRLPMIASEEVGLGDPGVVAQVCSVCGTWILLKKESKNIPDALPLLFCVMLLSRSRKNREIDDAAVVIREEIKHGEKSLEQAIKAHEALIVDSHTARGKERLRKVAAATGKTYEQLSWEQFYKEGAILENRIELNGNPWGHRAYRLFDLDYDEVNGEKPKSLEAE